MTRIRRTKQKSFHSKRSKNLCKFHRFRRFFSFRFAFFPRLNTFNRTRITFPNSVHSFNYIYYIQNALEPTARAKKGELAVFTRAGLPDEISAAFVAFIVIFEIVLLFFLVIMHAAAFCFVFPAFWLTAASRISDTCTGRHCEKVQRIWNKFVCGQRVIISRFRLCRCETMTGINWLI